MLQAVDRLCEHQYNPGPTATWSGTDSRIRSCREVYEDNHIDALMSRRIVWQR